MPRGKIHCYYISSRWEGLSACRLFWSFLRVGLANVCPCFAFPLFFLLRMVEIRDAAARFDVMSSNLVRQRGAAVVVL